MQPRAGDGRVAVGEGAGAVTAGEVMPEWSGWADVEPVIDGPEVVPARCSSQWSGEQASGRVVESRSLSKWIGLLLASLPSRSEKITRMFYGFDGERMLLKDIASAAGCSRSVARSISYLGWTFRRIARSVLSDEPPPNCRNDLARLIERSAIKRLDEPARLARYRRQANERAEAMERAKIAEAMRLQFRLAMYGKTFFAVSRDAVFALPWERLRCWRWNPWDLRMAQWSMPSLSNPIVAESVVMPYAPDGISTVRFRRGVNLAA